MLSTWFEQQWQANTWAQVLLRPLSWLFALLTALRRQAYRWHLLPSTALPVPVIVIGNISVGGVGKTPLVIALAQQLRAAGYTPGLLSRGYGGQQTGEVRADSLASMMGDEPVLLARQTGCPVWVHRKRVLGGQALLARYPAVDVLICDDGLQHYALQRDLEIAVVQRPLGLGNGSLLPAGPLREPLSRLQQVDLVVETGHLPATPAHALSYQLALQAGDWTAVSDFSTHTRVEDLQPQALLAVAGIGHPQRFFATVAAQGLHCEQRPLPDHHAYSATDVAAWRGKTLLMTEKDAVKCQSLGLENAWFLPVRAVLTPLGQTPALIETVTRLLKQRMQQRKGMCK